MAIEQDLIQKNKETYRRKPLLYTALILFILSWFLPAAEGYLGLMIVIQALPLLYRHCLLFGILWLGLYQPT